MGAAPANRSLLCQSQEEGHHLIRLIATLQYNPAAQLEPAGMVSETEAVIVQMRGWAAGREAGPAYHQHSP